MKVCLVSYENTASWILGSLTINLERELRSQGVDVVIADRAQPTADINHHIIYTGYDGSPSSIDTLMITHVDTADKVALLKRQMQVAEMGVCPSSDTMNKLVALGLPRRRLCYANFPSPQRGMIERRRTRIGITTRCHPHGSKREYLLGGLAQHLPRGEFEFHIMGSGWDCVIDELRRNGTEVVYYGDFETERYRRLWQSLDYYLYLGQDEGSTGLLDALEAGVPTIATPQGFHLDLHRGLVHSVDDLDDLVTVFGRLAEDRLCLRASVAHLDWTDYALKHLALWFELINRHSGRMIHPASRPHLEAIAFSTDCSVRAQPRLAAMPMEPGPGGAVHRPRLLVIADEPLGDVEDAWHKIVGACGDAIPLVLRREGEPPEPDGTRLTTRLEVKLVDWRSRDIADLATLSLDFDAVGFWNVVSATALELFGKRRKPNYLLRSNALSQLSGRLLATTGVASWLRPALYGVVRMLGTTSPAKTIGFLTRPPVLGPRFRSADDPGLRSWLSSVDTVIYTEDDWEPLVRPYARRFRRVPSLGLAPEKDAWAPAVDSILETMEDSRSSERPRWPLRVARAAQRAVNRARETRKRMGN
jgi:hypothetical protein